jgi:hypothetical protein
MVVAAVLADVGKPTVFRPHPVRYRAFVHGDYPDSRVLTISTTSLAPNTSVWEAFLAATPSSSPNGSVVDFPHFRTSHSLQTQVRKVFSLGFKPFKCSTFSLNNNTPHRHFTFMKVDSTIIMYY